MLSILEITPLCQVIYVHPILIQIVREYPHSKEAIAASTRSAKPASRHQSVSHSYALSLLSSLGNVLLEYKRNIL
jgi:hypothetical protein